MCPPEKLTTWSNTERASRIPPSAFWAMMFRASGSAVIPSCEATYCKCSAMSVVVIRWKSYTWHLDRIVGNILCFSVVARMKIAWCGGSSSVFKKALKAAADSMCTSSMINTLYLPI